MRLLLALMVAAAALWSGYWALAARGIEHGLSGWVEARRADGWAADLGTIEVHGFPARFDSAITDLALADPETGLAWSAPELRIESRSTKPHRFRVIWPETQQIATPREKIAMAAERMEGRLAFRPGPALAATRADFLLQSVALASTQGWRGSAGRAELAATALEGGQNRYAVTFTASDMRPPADLVRLVDRAGVLPALFETLEIEAVLGFDAPWDRHALEDRRPQATRIELARLDARWGRLALMAAGDLDIDEAGRPEGELTLRATNWREMVGIARASGQIPDALAHRLEQALALLAGLSGRRDTIDVPLSFSGGRSWLGPVPIGPAPDFSLR